MRWTNQRQGFVKVASPNFVKTHVPGQWNDRRYEVTVLADGYEFEGRTFRSLSAVAREITGTRWNGKVFFGLKKVYGRKAEGGSDA